MKKLLLVLAVFLAAIPSAGAGGFATVGLSSLPAGIAAGETWSVELTVKQHGRTPLDGIAPVVRIRGDGAAVREFAARPAGKPGVYRADVVFPREGSWRYEVWDGFGQTHTYEPVGIGAPSGGSFPVLPVALAGLGAAVLAGLAATLRRRSAGRPVPVS